jgi:hypothetical protein
MIAVGINDEVRVGAMDQLARVLRCVGDRAAVLFLEDPPVTDGAFRRGEVWEFHVADMRPGWPVAADAEV